MEEARAQGLSAYSCASTLVALEEVQMGSCLMGRSHKTMFIPNVLRIESVRVNMRAKERRCGNLVSQAESKGTALLGALLFLSLLSL